jgi:hypothetical protein
LIQDSGFDTLGRSHDVGHMGLLRICHAETCEQSKGVGDKLILNMLRKTYSARLRQMRNPKAMRAKVRGDFQWEASL